MDWQVKEPRQRMDVPTEVRFAQSRTTAKWVSANQARQIFHRWAGGDDNTMGRGNTRQRLDDEEVRNETYVSNCVEILRIYFCSFTRERKKHICTHIQVWAINSAEGNKSVSSCQGSHYSYKIQISLSYKCYNRGFIKAPSREAENYIW